MISPAEGELGRVTVIAPPFVLTKKPSPLTAVNGLVFAVVHQSTVPVLPKPVCDAPDAKAIVLPDSPKVNVDPDYVVTVFTLIVLVIIIDTYTLLPQFRYLQLHHKHHFYFHHRLRQC